MASWAVADSESNAVRSNEILILVAVILNRATGTADRPGTVSAVQIPWLLLDDVLLPLDLGMVAIVETSVIKHNVVHAILASRNQAVAGFMDHMDQKQVALVDWLSLDSVELIIKVRF